MYKIKITGSGTKDEICKALQSIIDSLMEKIDTESLIWEDKTLVTEISIEPA